MCALQTLKRHHSLNHSYIISLTIIMDYDIVGCEISIENNNLQVRKKKSLKIGMAGYKFFNDFFFIPILQLGLSSDNNPI